jgi:hypothetical protein
MQSPAWLRHYNAYRAHPDPRMAAGNTLALALASNGPLYPIYLFLLDGWGFWPSLIPMVSVPVFALVPAIARRHTLAGRVVMLGVSTFNSVLYALLFGVRSELQLFLLPCMTLGLLFPYRQRWLGWTLALLPLAAFLWLLARAGGPVHPYTDAQFHSMALLSEASLGTLSWFMMLLFSPVKDQE